MPAAKQPAAKLIGGTVNGTGSLVMRADKVGADTMLARIVTMVADAQRSRAPIRSCFMPGIIKKWTQKLTSMFSKRITPEEYERMRQQETAYGEPVIRVRRPLDHRGRARRWTDHVTGLVEAQVEFAAWLDSLPDNLRDSPLAEALQAICDLDLSELQAIVPPRGFGRD
jgi:E1-E2 ATPase